MEASFRDIFPWSAGPKAEVSQQKNMAEESFSSYFIQEIERVRNPGRKGAETRSSCGPQRSPDRVIWEESWKMRGQLQCSSLAKSPAEDNYRRKPVNSSRSRRTLGKPYWILTHRTQSHASQLFEALMRGFFNLIARELYQRSGGNSKKASLQPHILETIFSVRDKNRHMIVPRLFSVPSLPFSIFHLY
ncbi:uncharacterized protein LOC110344026 isoform X2 [Heterocephalus glaber]|uniref:Uncharacterized protein LOC110344026 isoform X2 n=1 Tax=Heterocephalus glaber TaxID=10181 RepID=A0AAX6R482_HETGA|nr:uncharacterized protein LOC110344026 isoform X2 [Heterocephalus glaber]